MLLAVTLSMFLYGFTNADDLVSEEEKNYQLLLSSDEELEEKYMLFYEEEEIKVALDLKVEEQLLDYLVEENGGKYFDVPYETYLDLSEDLKNIVDASIYVFDMYLNGDAIIDDFNEYVIKTDSETISLQDEEFKVVWKKTLGIPWGFELKFAPGTWSYIAATIAIVGGSVNMVWDILSFDSSKIMRLAYMMTGSLQNILLDIVTYITKLPSAVIKVSQTLLMLAKNNPYTGTILNIVMFAFKFVFPPMVHGFAAFKAVEQNKSVSYHYILPLIYSKTTVNNQVV